MSNDRSSNSNNHHLRQSSGISLETKEIVDRVRKKTGLRKWKNTGHSDTGMGLGLNLNSENIGKRKSDSDIIIKRSSEKPYNLHDIVVQPRLQINSRDKKDNPKVDSASSQSMKQPLLANRDEHIINFDNVSESKRPLVEQKNVSKYSIFEPSFVSKYVVPAGALGLLLHDSFHYVNNTNRRYSYNFSDVFIGWAFKNPNYFLSNFFGNKVKHLSHWLPISCMMLTTIASHFIPKSEKIHGYFAKPCKGSLNIPAPIQGFYRYIGKPLAYIGFIYGWGHYLKLMLQKSIQLAMYYRESNNCSDLGKAYSYLSHAIDYVCTVCGDWNFVYPPYTTSSQKCLDSLLRQSFSSNTMLEYLSRIEREGDITRITLPSSWLFLPENQLTDLLNSLQRSITGRLERLILTAATDRTFNVSPANIRAFGNFIRRTNPRETIINDQVFGDAMPQLFPSFTNTTMESLTFNNNGLTDSLSEDFFLKLPNSLTYLSVADNKLSINRWQDIMEYARMTSLASINLSGNSFSNVNFEITGTGFIRFDFSGNPITEEQAYQIGQFILENPIAEVNFANCGINDYVLAELSAGFNSTHLSTVNLSTNPITSSGFQMIDTWPPNLRHLELRDIDPGEGGFSPVFKQTQKIPMANLILSGSTLNIEDVVDLPILIRQGKLNKLDISYCNLDKILITEFLRGYPQESNLKFLSLEGNNIDDEEIINKILNIFKKIRIIGLSNNNVNVLNAYGNIADNIEITDLNAARTNVQGTSLETIRSITSSNIQSLDLSESNWSDELQNQMTRQLITDPPDLEEMQQEILSDEAELKYYYSTPRSKLRDFIIEKINLNISTQRALINTLYSAKIDFDNTGVGKSITWSKGSNYSTLGGIVMMPLTFVSLILAFGTCFKLCRKNKVSNNPSTLFSKEKRKEETVDYLTCDLPNVISTGLIQ